MTQLTEAHAAMIRSLDIDHSMENLARINRIAVELGDGGQRAGAEKLLECALESLEAHYPEDAYTISVLALNLGLQLDWQEKYEVARAQYEQAIAAREKALGSCSPKLWFPLYLLGNLFSKIDRMDSDRVARRKVLERAHLLAEKSADAETSQAADCLLALAATYDHLVWGDDQSTKVGFTMRALRISEKACGASSLQAATALRSLAIASMPGDAQEVVGYLCRAIDIYESASRIDLVKAGFRNLYGEVSLFGYDSDGVLRKRLDAIDVAILHGV
jgi:tetratricopeptide (TPR) repeat protein